MPKTGLHMNRMLWGYLLWLWSFALGAQTQWEFVSRFPSASVRELATDASSGRVYALLSDQSIVHSTDDGLTWEPLVETPAFFNVTGIEADGGRLWAATSCCGVGYTDDLGAHWQWDNLSTHPVSGLGLAPVDVAARGNSIFALSPNFQTNPPQQQLYHSAQAGSSGTWSLRHVFADGAGTIERVFHPFGSLVFVSLLDAAASGLERSDDLGQTFSPLSAFAGMRIVALVAGPDSALYCAAQLGQDPQLLMSTDGGLSWSALPWSGSAPMRALATGASAGSLFVLDGAGLHFSEDVVAGEWQTLLADTRPDRLVHTPGQTVLVGGLSQAGLLRAPSSSTSFEQVELALQQSPLWMTGSGAQLVVGPANTPMAAALQPADGAGWHTFWLEDLGGTGVPGFTLSATPLPQGAVLIGGPGFLARLDADQTLSLVADAGSAPTAPPAFVQLLPFRLRSSAEGEVLMTQSNFAQWIDRSPDGGLSWTDPLSPIAGTPTEFVVDFAKAPQGYFVLTQDAAQIPGSRLYFSTDGATWEVLPLPAQITARRLFLDGAGTLYLFGTSPTGLYRFQPATQGWQQLPIPLDNDPNQYFALAFNSHGHLYAIAFHTTGLQPEDGLYLSTDGGESWSRHSFPEVAGAPVVLDAPVILSDDRLYAKVATQQVQPASLRGIFRWPAEVTTSAEDAPARVQAALWPNPAHDHFFLRAPAGSRWQLRDALGRQVMAGRMQHALQRIELPRGMAAGAYWLLLHHGPDTQWVLPLIVGR